MYSGLLPKGLTDAEMSSDDEDDQGVANQEIAATNVQRPAVGLSPGLKQNCVTLGDTSYSSIQPFIENDPCLDSLPGIPRRFGKNLKSNRRKKDEINTMKLPQKRQQRKGRYKKDDTSATKNMESNTESREPQAEHERHWDGLTQYFGINDRFQPPACSKPAPKSSLEKSIESAIAEGDFGKAEEMSDRLATREVPSLHRGQGETKREPEALMRRHPDISVGRALLARETDLHHLRGLVSLSIVGRENRASHRLP
eukprot:XP_014054992.1 PREDICTED: protein FAM204A isoform X7 [Salmo salar]